MGFWPFGGGKRQRVVEADDRARETLLKNTPSDKGALQEKVAGQTSGHGRTGSKTRNEEQKTRRLSKTRTPSSKAVNYVPPSRSQTAPVRAMDDTRRTSRTNSQYDEKGLYQQNMMSQSSLVPENFTVVQAPPTLHAKRSENDSNLPRRKSSKRKAEDYAREREIRAISSSPIPIPKRPATLYDSGVLERDSRQIPGPLNRRLQRPTSEISLPWAGSLPDVIDLSNQNSFKVGMLAALSPRPTIRYDSNPKYSGGKQPARPNMAIRQAIAEEDVSDKKRIDELADDLDAGGLRELMERDRRRRERKKEADKVKLQRKLQRRAERQREEEARRARTEAFVRSSPGIGPQTQGLGIEPATDSKELALQKSPVDPYETDPFSDPGPSSVANQERIRNPFEDEKDMDVMGETHDSDNDEADSGAIPVPVGTPLRQVEIESAKPREKASQSTLSPPVSPIHRAADRSSLSQGSLLNRDVTPDFTESASLERRISEQSSQRLSSWTTFFKRGSRRKFAGPSQGRATPSEFSNTSRESISRKQPPVATPRTFRRSDSATPQRTMSRFKEDLPELPISPPDSRMQSPEASVPPTGNALSSEFSRADTPSLLNASSARDSIGLQLGEHSDRFAQQRSVDLDVPLTTATGMILSQSLASVDSEGSWLSGKPPKRLSGQLSHALKQSQSSLQKPMPGAFEQGEDDDDIMEDEFYSRLHPPSQGQQPQQKRLSIERRASSTILDLKSEQLGEDAPEVPALPDSAKTDDEQWHQGIGKQPTVVRQPGRAKSKEGLLNESAAAAAEKSDSSSVEDDDQDSDGPEVAVGETSLLRAKSVEYKGHIRHVSAGSAKLLDIRRSSVHSDRSRPATAARKSDLTLSAEEPSPTQPES